MRNLLIISYEYKLVFVYLPSFQSGSFLFAIKLVSEFKISFSSIALDYRGQKKL